jgi:hypothetical protein
LWAATHRHGNGPNGGVGRHGSAAMGCGLFTKLYVADKPRKSSLSTFTAIGRRLIRRVT